MKALTFDVEVVHCYVEAYINFKGGDIDCFMRAEGKHAEQKENL